MPTQGDVVRSTLDAWCYQDRISATDARYALASYAMPVAGETYISYRGGVYTSGDSGGVGGSTHMAMRVQPGSGLSVTVEMGNCIIDTPSNGPYTCTVDARKTLDLDPASTTQDRIDLVIARIYDDDNTAIGSPADVRKFCVEVWTGDGASSGPSPPIPTPSAGWIPLAEVYVGKNTSSVSYDDISDRRGPGLTSRGGMRLVHGADAQPDSAEFNAPGAYPGDQRWVHGHGFQHQVYYGDNDNPMQSGWRGVHNVLFYEKVADGGSYRFTGVGNTREVCRVTIPYAEIGTPFRIEPSARMTLGMAAYMVCEHRIQVDGTSGPTVNWNRVESFRSGPRPDEPASYISNVPAWPYGIFTSDVTVVMSVSISESRPGDFGVSWDGDGDDLGGKLTVRVYPAPGHAPTG